MKLHLYFARRFLRVLLSVIAVFLLLGLMLDLLEQLRRFGSQDIGFAPILRLALLNVPKGIYSLLPLIVVIATLFLFLSLARSSELVVTRAAGRSALNAVMAPLTVAFLFGAVSVAVLNPIVAATSRAFEFAQSEMSTGSSSIFSVSKEGLWLRQGSAQGQIVIRAARSNLDGTELYQVSFLGFTPDGLADFRIEADTARLDHGVWDLSGTKRWSLNMGTNPEADARLADSMTIPTTLTQDEVRDTFGTPSAVAFWALPEFIDKLEAAGFSARAYRMWFQSELAMPITLAAMVLIGAGFTMRHTRFGNTGLMVLFAILFGFSFHFLRNFVSVLGENGELPVPLAAWAPPIAAILLTLAFLLHTEDG